MDGLKILKQLFDKATDSDETLGYKKNLDGIIYMCTEHPEPPP
jgi:hypothetical protein